MKKIILDENRRFKHWYRTGNDITGVVEVSDEVAMQLSQNPLTTCYLDGEIHEYIPPSPPFDFAEAFAQKHSKIISAYKQAMLPIRANYTDEDIASFPTQEAEAKAWDADNTAETPLLDYMLANRPTVDKATLVSRILQNAVVYKQIAGPAIGKKQYLEDQLYALKAQHEDPDQPDVTQADIDAIVVDFSTS